MSFSEFIYEQGIIGVTIGTITGFAVSNMMKDINQEVIVKVLRRFKISNAGLISSIIEFILQMLVVYLLYSLLLYPLFRTNIKREKEEEKEHNVWKEDLLHEVKTVDMGTVYLS